MENFDVTVLGGGPGGYVAAIRAAQHTDSVALIEANEMGGTCLNRGCIPSKTLLANASLLHKIKHASLYGIHIGNISFNYLEMVNRKDEVVQKIRTSLEALIKANKIKIFNGFGKLISPNEIKISGNDNEIISADKIIIATGSEPREIPAFPFDHQQIHDSTSILNMKNLPKNLAIVGGGVIGCEFASLFHELDVEVTILETLPSIISMEGIDLSKALTESFTKRGINILTNAFVEGIDKETNGLTIRLKDNEPIVVAKALVAVGRQLNTDGIGLEVAGVYVNEQGVIPVNEKMETNVPGIYAIGDITAKWMLAHVASHQGMIAADNACGLNARMHYDAVPSVTFTHPEVASVGWTPEKSKEMGYTIKISKFPFMALGKSQAAIETEGFVQIVSEPSTGKILGAQVIGHEASSLIAQLTLAKNNELTIDCITETIHAHPTIAEAWLEAALLANDIPIHFPPIKKQ